MSLSERIDTTTAARKMVFWMSAVLAEFERDLVFEQTTAALAHKAGRGERVGEIPFGWTLGADGVTLVENPAEQVILADIRELRADGRTYRAIAAELTGRGVLTKKGKEKWTHQPVGSILKRWVA